MKVNHLTENAEQTEKTIECGLIKDLNEILHKIQMSQICLSDEIHDEEKFNDIKNIPIFYEIKKEESHNNLLEQEKLIIEKCNYYRIKRSKNYYLYFKSLMDRFLGFVFLLISSPVIFFWIIFIYYKERENPIFIQKRLGKNGKLFNIIKLRSMKNEQVTDIGKIIRKYRFDEMPQFFNIIKGDMSLCGPRPLIPKEYEGEDELFYNRLSVKPGITGWAQINGPLKDVNDKKYYDNYYIKNVSLLLDLFIIYHTAKTVFTGKRLRDKNEHYEPIREE